MKRLDKGMLGWLACYWFNLTVKSRSSWFSPMKYANALKWTQDFRDNATLHKDSKEIEDDDA